MVFIYHSFGSVYGFFLPWKGWFRDFSGPPSNQLLWFYPITYGWAGVSLFFVLSGFCIHLSFLRNKTFNVSHFFWRRIWRIYPAYILALLTFIILNHINILSRSGATQFLSHALLIHNFMNSTFFGINASFWSIATEAQLYLLFPLLLFFRSRFGISQCLFITFFLGLIWRATAVWIWGLPDYLITPPLTFPLMTWFDWTLGAFVAERFFYKNHAFTQRRIWLSVCLPVFIASTLFKPLTTFSFSLAAVVAAIILDAALHMSWRKHFLAAPLAFIGAVSYSLYLWHQPLIFRIVYHLQSITNSTIAAWFLLFPFMVAVSWMSFRIVEKLGIYIGDSLWKHRHQLS